MSPQTPIYCTKVLCQYDKPIMLFLHKPLCYNDSNYMSFEMHQYDKFSVKITSFYCVVNNNCSPNAIDQGITKYSAYTVVAMLSSTTCYIKDRKNMQLVCYVTS